MKADEKPIYTQLKNRNEQLALRRELRNHGTSAEATLWQLLKNRQVLNKKFRRQFSVGEYVLDFYCPELRLAIELDGSPHYTFVGQQSDLQRDAILKSEYNIKVLRFENRVVFNYTDEVLRSIKTEIENLEQGDKDSRPSTSDVEQE